MKLIKKGYNSAYFKTATDIPFLEKLFNSYKIKLIHSLSPSGNLLEIGCGRGILLNQLKKFYSVKGCDISPIAIAHASKLIGKKNLRVLDIEKQNISGKYEIILAFDVLEHLKNPEKALNKIKKSLKKEGIFIFSVPNNYGLFGSFMTKFFNFVDRTHISTYKRKKWIFLFKQAGFNLEIRNQHLFGISKSEFTKHFSFNLIGIARK